jgi:hypothetical protein
MSRGLHADTIAELQNNAFNMCNIVEFQFDTAQYLTDYSHDITHDGQVYDSSSSLLAIASPKESHDLRVNSINLELSGVNQTFISLFLTGNWINRKVIIRQAVIGSDGQIIGDPFVVFDGQMTQFEVDEDNKSSRVIVSIASHWADFEKTNGRFTNDNSQQFIFPGDRGMEYAANSIRDIKWGRK